MIPLVTLLFAGLNQFNFLFADGHAPDVFRPKQMQREKN
ncbi:MAG: hypothetical protein KF775_15965 [Cyclobacteriaceae bacterium]|nr:hypothetical protein [Cytophagales bacterium]MBX2901151.1 hypothetical protein [Cyclobacteriaceae bacterium]